jgi:triosephosphate isomerase (TIM)
MRKPIIAGNWKMHKTIGESQKLVRQLKGALADVDSVEIVVSPPFTSLVVVMEELKGSNISVAAQNMYWEETGAYTGEVSPLMLKDIGCTHVIIGHSERRQFFNETDTTVNKKVKAALKAGLTPIVCVGETLEEREFGSTMKIVEKQIREGLDGLAPQEMEKIVIAYEPIWAIGTGKTATPEQAEEVHHLISSIIAQSAGGVARNIRILYGGSVKPDNIDDLMAQPDIDGALVGGASLTADSFIRIVRFKMK